MVWESPGSGKKTAADLAEVFGSLKALMEAEEEALTEVPEIGAILASNIYHYFRDPKIKEEIAALLAAGVKPLSQEPTERKARSDQENPFAGKKVVVTGTLVHFSRREIQEKLRQLGASPQESVSGATDYLIYGEKAGSKLEKAKRLKEKGEGPQLLTEEEFFALMESGERRA